MKSFINVEDIGDLSQALAEAFPPNTLVYSEGCHELGNECHSA